MILQLQNINFSFSFEKQIVNDLSLALEEKQVYALMGSNGAGKTTLFNIICGFIKPQGGSLYFKERNITNQQPFKVNRFGIGRTFQDLRLISKLTVKQNVILSMKYNPTDNWFNAMLPIWFHQNANRELDNKADEIIKQFFLTEESNSLAGEISYGQQKLLSLACCISNEATLLLIDEAVAGIQPDYRDKIVLLIKQLKEKGKTIFLIEHNTDFIADVADRIFFLHEGKFSTFDNIEILRKDKQVMEAYI